MKKFFASLKTFGKQLSQLLIHNLAWKILSLFIAVLLWSYVISSDASITRDVSLSGVDVIVSGQSVLQGRELALLTDAASELANVRVRVRVAQSDYARVTADSVSVELDLSRIRQTGTQVVTLTGNSAYGDVVDISPETIALEVEELDQRTVPVNIYLDQGEATGYWYNLTQRNPSIISVSGPSSVVRQVSSAMISMDVSELTASTVRAEPYSLLDASGMEITFPLTRSTSTVNVGVDVYPVKQLTVGADPVTCTTGALPEGYRISGVEINPAMVTVAGEQTLLEALDTIAIVPVDVTNARQSFSTIAALSGVSDLKYTSSAQVTVTVYIEEIQTTDRYDQVSVYVRGASSGSGTAVAADAVEIKITGPYSSVIALEKDDIIAYVDVSGLAAGEYELPIQVEVDNFVGLSFEVYPEKVKVSVTGAQ